MLNKQEMKKIESDIIRNKESLILTEEEQKELDRFKRKCDESRVFFAQYEKGEITKEQLMAKIKKWEDEEKGSSNPKVLAKALIKQDLQKKK